MASKFLSFIDYRLVQIHRLALKRPKITLAFFAIFLCATLGPIKNLKTLVSIDDLVDPDFQTYQQLQDLRDRFLSKDEIFIIIRHRNGGHLNKNHLCRLTHWIQNLVDTRRDLNAISSTLGVGWPIESHSQFKLKNFFDLDCTTPQKPEHDKIAQATTDIVQSPWRGILTSEDGKDVAILIYPEARTDASIMGTFNPKIVEELKADFQKTVLEKYTELEALWIGDGIFQYYLHKGYETMPYLNLLMSLFIIIFFRIFLGTFISSGLFLSVVTWISLPVYAGMGIMGHPIDVLSSSLSLMIFISSLEDFIFLSHFTKKYGRKEGIRKLLLPSFFTSLTTVIGFGSLLFADLDMIRRFGLWASISAALEWIFMFLALPALLEVFPKIQNWIHPQKSLRLSGDRILKYVIPKKITFLGLLVFPLALFATQYLYVSDSPIRLLEEDHPTRQDLREVEKSRGWQGQASIVFPDYEDKHFNKEVLRKVNELAIVDQIEDPYTIQDYLTTNLSPGMRSYFAELMKQNTLGHRLGPDRKDFARSVLYLNNIDIIEVNIMRKAIENYCLDLKCWPAGSIISYGELGERVLSTLYKSLGGSLILVSLIILLLCFAKKNHNFYYLLLSAMWGPAALLCVFYLFDIPIYYILSMVASILVGMTGDNAIQFLFFSQDKNSFDESINQVGHASLLVFIGTILACSVFFFGYFDPMKNLGGFMILGFILSLVGDIWILRSLNTNRKLLTKNKKL